MAKEKRKNTAVDAIGSLMKTIGTVAKIELAGNPEAIAEVDKMLADVTDSNLTTAMEHLDDNIETKHQTDAVLEGAGIDPVQHGRDNALAGAIETANAVENVEVENADAIDTE